MGILQSVKGDMLGLKYLWTGLKLFRQKSLLLSPFRYGSDVN